MADPSQPILHLHEMATSQCLPLHSRSLSRWAGANRAFALVFSCFILSLLFNHFINLLHSTTIVALLILLADSVLAFMWVTTQAFRMFQTERQTFIEHLEGYTKESDYPGLDVFICTADPHKEPPMGVVNTALSVMAYDYPTEKLSVYLSDDGGSELTLFAFMEAARFAAHWLPYCRRNKIVERCPEAYFGSSNSSFFPETNQIQMMYKNMKARVENATRGGSISHDYIASEEQSEAFRKWDHGFTPQNHPPVIQVLLERGKDKDTSGRTMPNLVYISREKRLDCPHSFKAGALNVLLRVSAAMTNAPVILNLDCDMYSNDPQTPLRALCYLLDPSMDPKLAFVQFPQTFHGLNKNDTYAGEMRQGIQIHLPGMDGLAGPFHIGTGAFFRREVISGCFSDCREARREEKVRDSIKSEEVLALAHHVAGCEYEKQTKWGIEKGFRYGPLVEDFFTSFLLQCEGWKSVYCKPKRPAFLGRSPITLHDFLNQMMRGSIGLLDVAFSKHSPIVYGVLSINLLSGLCFAHFAFWAIWSIPIAIYAFLPQLALLNSISIFPKISDPWFWVYLFLFLGNYGQDYLEFVSSGGGGMQRWWNHQRVWTMRGLSSCSFGSVQFLLKSIGISGVDFKITNKAVEEGQSRRYEQGIFEFGLSSPLFLPLTTAAIINLGSFLWGIALVFKHGGLEDILLQMLLAGFAMVNCWPVYEAMVLRTDDGKLPVKITLISVVLAWALYSASSMAF